MKAAKSLYYLAIIPPEPVRSEIRAFKEYALEHYGSGHALRSPAHITLIPPFHLDSPNVQILKDIVSKLAQKSEPFDMGIKNFACFPPRVIYIDVEEQLSLTQIQHDLQTALVPHLGLKIRDKQSFQPHMTVAFRYPDETIFPKAWTHFSQIEYARTFEANGIALLRHESKRWEIIEEFEFGNTSG